MPYTHKHWLKYSQNGGPWVYNNNKFAGSAAPGVVIDCEDGQSGCQDEVDWWGYAYENVSVIRTELDSFYTNYFDDKLSAYLTSEKLNYLFPDLQNLRPGAIDSLLNGNYRFWITKDSSIIIVKAPLDSVGIGNLVWAVDRHCDER
jgi:hypothetical protein